MYSVLVVPNIFGSYTFPDIYIGNASEYDGFFGNKFRTIGEREKFLICFSDSAFLQYFESTY
jgi:hypothetical protein